MISVTRGTIPVCIVRSTSAKVQLSIIFHERCPRRSQDDLTKKWYVSGERTMSWLTGRYANSWVATCNFLSSHVKAIFGYHFVEEVDYLHAFFKATDDFTLGFLCD